MLRSWAEKLQRRHTSRESLPVPCVPVPVGEPRSCPTLSSGSPSRRWSYLAASSFAGTGLKGGQTRHQDRAPCSCSRLSGPLPRGVLSSCREANGGERRVSNGNAGPEHLPEALPCAPVPLCPVRLCPLCPCPVAPSPLWPPLPFILLPSNRVLSHMGYRMGVPSEGLPHTTSPLSVLAALLSGPGCAGARLGSNHPLEALWAPRGKGVGKWECASLARAARRGDREVCHR